jgi:mRNA deadenylase 3'-5' endonuclease subunit Ccr4
MNKPTPVTYPLEREWIQLNHSPTVTQSFEGSTPIKVMSYNILAQSLMNRRERFTYLSKKGGRWNFRRSNLLTEIKSLDCDVVCLQECDFYQDYWKGELEKLGFETLYNQQGKDGATGGELMPYGILTAWRKDKFTLRKAKVVNFRDLCFVQNVTPEAPPTYMEELELKLQFNVAHVIALQLNNEATENNTAVMITNTHLWWRWDYTYTRLRQTIVLLEEIVAMNAELYAGKCPVISCGDFNSQAQNLLYSFMTYEDRLPKFIPREGVTMTEEHMETRTAHLRELVFREKYAVPKLVLRDHHEEIKTKMQESGYTDTDEYLNHMLDLRVAHIKCLFREAIQKLPVFYSSYGQYTAVKGLPSKNIVHTDNTYWLDPELKTLHGGECEPHFTNFVVGFCETLDYIFVCHNKEGILTNQLGSGILPTYILEIPEIEKLSTATALPNEQFSSDHVALVCQLAIRSLQK